MHDTSARPGQTRSSRSIASGTADTTITASSTQSRHTRFGGSATAGSASAPFRKVASVTHGVALALIFVAGFGLLARLGHFGEIPIWAYVKMALWAVLALCVVPLKRRPEWAPVLWFLMPVVGGVAVWLAVAQPF